MSNPNPVNRPLPGAALPLAKAAPQAESDSSPQQTPRFTVGIPVYRGMPWLREAIESLAQQSFRDFTVLVVLDGPDPESAAYLAGVRGLSLRVIERPHRGLVEALNCLLEESPSPWLVRQDADDLSCPHRLAVLDQALQQYPEARLVASRARYIPERSALGRFRSSHGSPIALRRAVSSGRLLSFCHSSVALHVETARKVGGYREIPYSEDSDLWWRMALVSEVRTLPQVLTGFRQSDQSISSRHHEEQQISGLYVQYLLLSHLWGLTPQPLAAIEETLSSLLHPGATRAKHWLRASNMYFSERKMGLALASLLRCAWNDPFYLPRRLWQEWSPQLQTNGVAPERYEKKRDRLWKLPSARL